MHVQAFVDDLRVVVVVVGVAAGVVVVVVGVAAGVAVWWAVVPAAIAGDSSIVVPVAVRRVHFVVLRDVSM